MDRHQCVEAPALHSCPCLSQPSSSTAPVYAKGSTLFYSNTNVLHTNSSKHISIKYLEHDCKHV